VTNIPHADRGVGYTYIDKTTKGKPMAKRKPTITIEDFNDNWGDAYAKLLRNRKFQQAIHSEKVEDGVETIWLVDKLMRGVLKENKYEAVMAAFDDDVLDAWEYLSGKLPALLDSQSKD
jgi:hypothetical protein